jgi:hypothetical protein
MTVSRHQDVLMSCYGRIIVVCRHWEIKRTYCANVMNLVCNRSAENVSYGSANRRCLSGAGTWHTALWLCIYIHIHTYIVICMLGYATWYWTWPPRSLPYVFVHAYQSITNCVKFTLCWHAASERHSHERSSRADATPTLHTQHCTTVRIWYTHVTLTLDVLYT